jgi:hypothetical protein
MRNDIKMMGGQSSRAQLQVVLQRYNAEKIAARLIRSLWLLYRVTVVK